MQLSGHGSEELNIHILKTVDEYNIMSKNYNINKMIKSTIDEDNNILSNTLKDIFDNAILYHDMGKYNPLCQNKFRNNERLAGDKYGHSKIGTIKFINDMYEKFILKSNFENETRLKQLRYKRIISSFIINCSYNILKHHNRTGIENRCDIRKYVTSLTSFYNNNLECFKDEHLEISINNLNYFNTIKEYSFKNPIKSFLLFRLNYALLVKSDYLATYSYYNNDNLKDNRIGSDLKETLTDNFNTNDIIKSIYKFKNNEMELTEINKYRAEMFLESQLNLINNKDKYLFFLEAPTGSGKSTIAINLALNLLSNDMDRIVYVSPLNNISEQMYRGACNSLKTKDNSQIALINNKQAIVSSNDEYSKDYLNYQTFNYPIIMTSNVRLFNILFSNSRENMLALESLKNSIIILDEIQNYKNVIWIHIINMISQIAKTYNIKFIIMSATLPKMDKLLQFNNKIELINLIHNTKYYFDYFKKRVEYDYSLLKDTKNSIEDIYYKLNEIISSTKKHRILIETLTTVSCEKLYNILKEKYENQGFMIFKMLGQTNSITRNEIMNIIQEKENNTYKNKKIILIGTQCIEAGLDIDMQIGFKDISLLDYDEQFIGRIERNFNDIGICYFFNMDNDDFIYKDDYRIEHNLTNKEYRNMFENKDFNTYYNSCYDWLLNREMNNYNKFLQDLNDLQYENISKTMKLIDNNTYNFLFKENLIIDNETYSATDILNEYEDVINSKMDYSEKQIKAKNLKIKLNIFIYSMPSYKLKEEPIVETKYGLYIIENGLKYFDNIYNNNLTKLSSLNLTAFIDDLKLFI